MIAFASLFLGLVLGLQTVEVVVSEEVKVVEILLNGQKVAEISGPPWSAECDLGDELAPHELVAVARGARGEEIARAEQWINLPRAPAEAALILEEGPGGRGRTARLTWNSLAGARPRQVRVLFDDRPLEIEDPARFELPNHDPNSIHFLRAELDFDAAYSSAEIVFGGRFADRTSSELTAIPVAANRRGKLPPAQKLDGWFRVGEREARVIAVDKGVAEIVTVCDQDATPDLRLLTGLHADPSGKVERRPGRHRTFRTAWGDWRLQLLSPRARRLPGSSRIYDLFPMSPYLDNKRGPLPLQIAAGIQEPVTVAPQRLADGVVVAGLSAAAGKRRRAVILVLSGAPEDASRVKPDNARRFLERLRVPLFVWTTSEEPSEAVRSWGSVVDVSSGDKLQSAASAVELNLERQRVVWLEGRHLPDRIALTERAAGFHLAH